MKKRFKYDYNNKMFIVCFLSSLLFLSIFIWSFNKNIVGCIAAGLCTIILLFNTFVMIFNQGITVGKKNILVIDYFWFTKINIKDLKHVEIREIKKEKKGNLYGFFHEFYHPTTYMWKCDYVYNNGRVFKVIFHLKDGTSRETYFGWMYKERNILKVKKTIKKLEECINYINLISKNKSID